MKRLALMACRVLIVFRRVLRGKQPVSVDLRQAAIEPLPEPTHMEMVLGILLVRLEVRHPGITNEMLEQIEQDVNRLAVTRLRSQATPRSLHRAMAFASRWLAGASVFADSQLGPLAARLKRKGRH